MSSSVVCVISVIDIEFSVSRLGELGEKSRERDRDRKQKVEESFASLDSLVTGEFEECRVQFIRDGSELLLLMNKFVCVVEVNLR